MDDTDTGSTDPYMPDSDKAWGEYYISLRRSLELQVRKAWNISDYQAEAFVDHALDQPRIRKMIAGQVPKQLLSRNLLIRRLNQVYARYRKAHVKEESLMDADTKCAEDNTAETAINNLFTVDLKNAIRQLPEKERNILILRYLLNRSFADIGRTLGTSDETARRTYQRAVQLLRTSLDADE